MGEFKKEKFQLPNSLKRTSRVLIWIWIISLFLSPYVGLFSILMISCIEISYSIDWGASFTGKKM